MPIDVQVGPRQAAPVNHGCVVQRIGEHGIAGANQCGDRAEVRGIAGVEGEGGRRHEVPGDLSFEFLVFRVRSVDQPGSTSANAGGLECLPGGCHQPGVGGQTEVVVRGKVDRAAAGGLNLRTVTQPNG